MITGMLLSALGCEQFGPVVSHEGFGVSEPSVPVIKHSVGRNATRNILLRDVAHIDVDEVGILGRPVERRGGVPLGDGEDLLPVEGDLYRVLLHMLLLVVVGRGYRLG